MKRVALIVLLFINIQSFAMQPNQGSYPHIYHNQKVQKAVIINSDNDSSIEEICENQKLPISNENTNIPQGYRNSKDIMQLNKKIVALKNTQVNGVKQPFTNWFGIINHIKDEQENNKFRCPFCNKNFSQVPSAASCFLRHFNQDIFTCEQCASRHETFRSYQKHSESCSKITKIISPVYEIIDIDDDLAKNILNQKIAVIDCCGLNLGNWITAINHIASQHKIGSKAYICNRCYIRYETSEKALECFLKHSDSTIFTCSSCNEDCVTRSNFLQHTCKVSLQQPHEQAAEPVNLVYYADNYLTNNTNVINTASYPYEEPELNSSSYNFDNSTYQEVQYSPYVVPMTPLTAMLYGNIQTPNSDQCNTTPSNIVQNINDESFLPSLAPKDLRTPTLINNTNQQMALESQVEQHYSYCNVYQMPQETFTPMLQNDADILQDTTDYMSQMLDEQGSLQIGNQPDGYTAFITDQQAFSRNDLTNNYVQCISEKNVDLSQSVSQSTNQSDFIQTNSLSYDSVENVNNQAYSSDSSSNSPHVTHQQRKNLEIVFYNFYETKKTKPIRTTKNITPINATKKSKKINITKEIKQPIELEGHLFDAAATTDYNIDILNKLIAARISSHKYSCCNLPDLEWKEFCRHQKEKHSKVLDNGKKIVCLVCNKSFRKKIQTNEHIAQHLHPKLFSCPVCVSQKIYSEFPYKETLVRHFKKCFNKKYVPNSVMQENNSLHINSDISNTNQMRPALNSSTSAWVDQSVEEYHNVFQFDYSSPSI